MTTPEQKKQERWVLERLLEALDVEPPPDIYEGEAPDFTTTIEGTRIGIEVTQFQSGVLTHDGAPLRKAEGEWEILAASALGFRRAHPHLHDLTVYLDFKASAPIRREHQGLLDEISAFVLEHAEDLGSEGWDYGTYHFSTPLMKRYLKELCLRPGKHSIWSSNLQGGWIGPPDQALTDIIIAKARKVYRPTDVLWLVITCGYRPSEIMSPLEGVADFDYVAGLRDALANSPFSRVLVWTNGGLFQWDRSDQWKKVETKH